MKPLGDISGSQVQMRGAEGPGVAAEDMDTAAILVSVLQANVEHLTDKMKTDIQRGLVLR